MYSPFGDDHAGCFPAELLSFFILFLPRGRKMAGEASSTEESERIGIFPDAASSVGAHRLAMLATAFLASEKIPMILSDNGRRGLTLETRERRRRQGKIRLYSGGAAAQP